VESKPGQPLKIPPHLAECRYEELESRLSPLGLVADKTRLAEIILGDIRRMVASIDRISTADAFRLGGFVEEYGHATAAEAASAFQGDRRVNTEKASRESRGSSVHPYLKDPENARAYALLARQETGSVRTWANSLSWSRGRMERFLAACEKYALADVTRSHGGTHFRPLIVGSIGVPGVPDGAETAETRPSIVRARAVELTTKAGLTAVSTDPRDLFRNRESVVNRENGDRLKNRLRPNAEERQEGAGELVAAMNGILCRNHPLDFQPVGLEQAGSHRAARRWLVEFGIPLADAIEILKRKVMAFNPMRINGEMPRSIGFFTHAMRAEWRRVLRDREQLKLSQEDEMRLNRREPLVTAGDAEPPMSPEQIVEHMAQLRAEFERVANDPKASRLRQ